MIHRENYELILKQLESYNATLVAVSKTKPVSQIAELQQYGQKIFGENYVQELSEKALALTGIGWHFIGHLQTNKVKQLMPIISLIQSVDSFKLLHEIDKEAAKADKNISCLLQIYIADEKTKTGFSYDEADKFLSGIEKSELKNIQIKGLMGLATNTADETKIRNEYKNLFSFFSKYKSAEFSILSMGMTSDYKIALDEGSTMVRIGSAIFGERNYKS
jgi:PLP dependent protein